MAIYHQRLIDGENVYVYNVLIMFYWESDCGFLSMRFIYMY